MAVTLGGVTLSDHLVIQGIETAPARAFGGQRLMGGAMHTDVGPALTGGRVLSLQSEFHLTQTDVDAIKELEAAGNAVSLVHPRGTFTVYITGVDVEPDEWLVDPDDADILWYSGIINLLEA
jgi:hypothetical protein